MLTMVAVGDTVVRELDFSRISLRVRDSGDDHDEEDKHKGKLTGNTMETLKQCLVSLTVHSCAGAYC